eukprot:756323-Hanusia_phi.AAC.1
MVPVRAVHTLRLRTFGLMRSFRTLREFLMRSTHTLQMDDGDSSLLLSPPVFVSSPSLSLPSPQSAFPLTGKQRGSNPYGLEVTEGLVIRELTRGERCTLVGPPNAGKSSLVILSALLCSVLPSPDLLSSPLLPFPSPCHLTFSLAQRARCSSSCDRLLHPWNYKGHCTGQLHRCSAPAL